jgi:hypothetical protein
MSAPPSSTQPSEFDALLAAISDGIAALVAWDIAAFDAAVELQREICAGIALKPASACIPAAARKVQDLNRVYDRLLKHSVHWTRTLHAILQTGGGSLSRRSPLHFRG